MWEHGNPEAFFIRRQARRMGKTVGSRETAEGSRSLVACSILLYVSNPLKWIARDVTMIPPEARLGRTEAVI